MRLSPTLLVSSALLGALLAHGCATVSSSVLVPQSFTMERTLGGTVRIEAEGTSKRAYVMRPLVRSSALEEALTSAIQEAELFDEVVGGSADRVLQVTVERVDEPEIGLDQTCTVALRWALRTGDGQQTLWEELITTERTVNSFEELDSETRGQRAIEGALRLNLRKGLERLSRAG